MPHLDTMAVATSVTIKPALNLAPNSQTKRTTKRNRRESATYQVTLQLSAPYVRCSPLLQGYTD